MLCWVATEAWVVEEAPRLSALRRRHVRHRRRGRPTVRGAGAAKTPDWASGSAACDGGTVVGVGGAAAAGTVGTAVADGVGTTAAGGGRRT